MALISTMKFFNPIANTRKGGMGLVMALITPPANKLPRVQSSLLEGQFWTILKLYLESGFLIFGGMFKNFFDLWPPYILFISEGVRV